MRKSIQFLFAITFLLIILYPHNYVTAKSIAAPVLSTPSELINEVNTIRAKYGFGTLQINPILMSIAQSQADYEQSIGSQTDIDVNGLHPYQRALAAGYLVAGNVTTNVGYLSELLFGGVNVPAKDAVKWWYDDANHKPYLLFPDYQDIGAGVAQSNNTFYYVIVIALSTGGTPVAYTPPPPLHTSAPTFIPNTPNSDGSIVHIVQKGDTALGIAIEYGISLTDLYKLNGLTDKSVIYQGTKIIIRAAYTPTPTQPTGTPTERPTITMWPTASFTATVSPIPPTPAPSPGLAKSAARNAVLAIAAAALVIAGVIAWLARKRK